MGQAGAGITMVLVIFGLVLAVLWIALPFAVFGTKDVLRKLLAEQQRTNELLAADARLRAPP